ncbi:MAG TPA: cytochrome c, partial [Polaromonas sp.]
MKILVVSLLLLAGTALADEGNVRLKEGPGKDKVMAQCVTCHSVDYIQMNSVFLDRNGWTASVN